ncbi:hypothetical protein NPIL_371141 [Nephila pilipes]|uniref:Uncharacterized protein n=1 Tax=Nephila pilipes TaxID=299642 RepID=A0A8X6NJA9_NEPPI|nr:hypothetical protein NPIL_371141 [Nephila pilipes]
MVKRVDDSRNNGSDSNLQALIRETLPVLSVLDNQIQKGSHQDASKVSVLLRQVADRGRKGADQPCLRLPHMYLISRAPSAKSEFKKFGVRLDHKYP